MKQLITCILLSLIVFSLFFYDSFRTFFKKKKIERFSVIQENIPVQPNDETIRNMIKSNIVSSFLSTIRVRYDLSELLGDYASKLESISELNSKYSEMVNRYKTMNQFANEKCLLKNDQLSKTEYRELLEECYDTTYMKDNFVLRNSFVDIEKILFDLFLSKVLIVQNIIVENVFDNVVNTFSINNDDGMLQEGIPEDIFDFRNIKKII